MKRKGMKRRLLFVCSFAALFELVDYFVPLKVWLDEQNKANHYPVGW